MEEKSTPIVSPAEFDYNARLKSREEICRIVAADFKLKGITHAAAGERLGVKKQVVTNQLSGRRPFGKRTAHAYALAFGYNEEFLLHGFGYLYADAAINDIMLAKGKSEEERSAELLARESELAEKVKRLQDELEREKEESKKKDAELLSLRDAYSKLAEAFSKMSPSFATERQ